MNENFITSKNIGKLFVGLTPVNEIFITEAMEDSSKSVVFKYKCKSEMEAKSIYDSLKTVDDINSFRNTVKHDRDRTILLVVGTAALTAIGLYFFRDKWLPGASKSVGGLKELLFGKVVASQSVPTGEFLKEGYTYAGNNTLKKPGVIGQAGVAVGSTLAGFGAGFKGLGDYAQATGGIAAGAIGLKTVSDMAKGQQQEAPQEQKPQPKQKRKKKYHINWHSAGEATRKTAKTVPAIISVVAKERRLEAIIKAQKEERERLRLEKERRMVSSKTIQG